MEALIFLGVVIAGIIGMLIGMSKGKGGSGFVLGLFLGPVGWIIAALLSPSIAMQADRDRQLAALSGETRGSYGGSGNGATARRQDAITEALRRDPSLESASSPDDLARLAQSSTSIEAEFRLRHDLETVKARQAHEADLARQEVARQRQAQLQADEEDRARQQAKQVREERAAARVRAHAERVANAAGMKPAVRTVYLHRGVASSIAGAVIVALVLVTVVIPWRAASENNERQRIALAATAASSASAAADVAASKTAAAAQVAAEKEISSTAAAQPGSTDV